MGLLGDLKEIQEGWKSRSLGYKILVAIALFFTVSSITSLSDVVFKWKGFILDGLEFYRTYYVENVRRVFDIFHLNYTAASIDMLTFIYLFNIPLIPIHWRVYRNSKSLNNLFAVSLQIAIVIISPVKEFIKPRENVSIVAFISLSVVFFSYLILFLLSLREPNERVVLIRPLFAILIVLVLAAINKGLSM